MANGTVEERRDIYSPRAYSGQYNKLLLDQITRPIKEREQEGIQALKEAFVAGGGYNPGAYLSGVRKLRRDVGEQIAGASADVSLGSATARFQEQLERDKLQWQTQENQKLQDLQKYLQAQGFDHDEIMAELNYRYQKDLLHFQYELQRKLEKSKSGNFLQNLTSAFIGSGTRYGLEKLFPIRSPIEKYLESYSGTRGVPSKNV